MNTQIDPYVENMLDTLARRQEALSSNLANIDTPGYKAKDVKFQDALSSSSLRLASTDPMHMNIGGGVGNSSIEMVEDDGMMKENGNNVDLERQMTELNKNGLQYVMLVQYMGSEFKTIKAAIDGGGRG